MQYMRQAFYPECAPAKPVRVFIAAVPAPAAVK